MRKSSRNNITKANRRGDRARRRKDAKRALAEARSTLKTVYDRDRNRGHLPPNLLATMAAQNEKEIAFEVHLLNLGYYSECKITGCKRGASVLARGVDQGGRPIKQIELCAEHAEGMKSRRRVRDLRTDSDG